MTTRVSIPLAIALSLPVAISWTTPSLTAQERTWKQVATIGGGVGVPGSDLRPHMSPASLLRLSYAYRFHRNLQAEAGLDALFGAAGVYRVESTVVGDVKINDSESLIPFGARALLPLARNRLELSAGGGGAYIFYSEDAGVPEGVKVFCPYGNCSVSVDCKSCTSRSGWGYYGVAGAAFSLNASRRLWRGLTGRFVRGTTAGQSLGSLAPFETRDQWFAAAVDLSYRF